MKQFFRNIVLSLTLLPAFGTGNNLHAQGMHFSQYYNAPLLLNPANTGLMSEKDFRVGANYRDQWAKIPVPYKTISAYGDFQALRGLEGTNWMGIGFAFFNDKAGDGELTLNKFEANIAYHVQVSEFSMISAGISGGYGQRNVNYNKLSFNDQWDGFKFNTLSSDYPNNEFDGTVNTSYFDVGAGVNYAFFPNEFTYIKIGAGLAHLNQPEETFYGQSGLSNTLGLRPTGNIDGLFRISESLTINPSIYYTSQKSSYELLFGSLAMVFVGDSRDNSTQLIFGGFYRWNEAAVVALGMQFNNMRVMASYDYTISSLRPDIKGNGGWELGLMYQGMYGNLYSGRKTINCPRF